MLAIENDAFHIYMSFTVQLVCAKTIRKIALEGLLLCLSFDLTNIHLYIQNDLSEVGVPLHFVNNPTLNSS